MDLHIGEETIANPSAGDVARAFATTYAEGTEVVLEDRASRAIEARARADGLWDFTIAEGDRVIAERKGMPSGRVRGIFLARLAGEAAFVAKLGDEGFVFDAPKSSAPPMTRAQLGLPPIWLFPAVFVALGAWIAGPGFFKLWTWPRLALPSVPLPAAIDSEPARVLAVVFLVALCLVLTVVAIVVLRFKRTREWPSVRGRIVESRRGEEGYRDLASTASRIRPVPIVRYAYEVGGVAYRGHRIDAGEGVGEDEIDGILRRYPVGAEVAVFHDPKNPKEAVLERQVPKDVARGCLAGLGIAFVFLVALMWLVTNGPGALRAALPHANLPVFLVSTIAGLLLLGATFAIVRVSEEARAWPRVPGRIAASGIRQQTRSRARQMGRTTRTVYAPWVRYHFTVAGQDHVGTALKHGVEVAGSRGYAEKVLARYPEGAEVQVSYDPANPSRSAIEHGSGLAWILPLMGGVALAIAAVSSGVFGG